MSKATVSTKGHRIDPNCKYTNGIILGENSSVYDCTLNQTEIGSNKNKFYIMQLIEINKKYIVYIRYGRIGETGRQDYKDFSSKYQAISFFEKQFRSKTGNAWNQRDNFVKKDGKYFMTGIETVDVSENSSESSSGNVELDDRVADFLKLISNKSYMKNTLVQLEVDTKKMPLGKINQSHIDKAYDILQKILNNLDDKEELVRLSSEFYTLVPYACGRQKPPAINSKKNGWQKN